MHVTLEIPSDWQEIPLNKFENLLRICPDYVRSPVNADAVRYSFRHNLKPFAVVVGPEGKEKVRVDPAML